VNTFDINVEKREVAGKSSVRKLKREGMVPGIIYNSHENIPISLDEYQMNGIFTRYGDDVLLNINYDGKAITARVKEVQRNPVSRNIQHIDLMPVESEASSSKLLH